MYVFMFINRIKVIFLKTHIKNFENVMSSSSPAPRLSPRLSVLVSKPCLVVSLLEHGTGDGGFDSSRICPGRRDMGVGETAGVFSMLLMFELWSMCCIKALNSGVSSNSLLTTS